MVRSCKGGRPKSGALEHFENEQFSHELLELNRDALAEEARSFLAKGLSR